MKISVIIPIYNKKVYLNILFQCICNQTFKEFECIVIDDGSTDGSAEICDEVEKCDKRFHIYHIPNSGVSHARNIGLKMAVGDFITFIDADDRVPANYLESLYSSIIKSKSDMVICTVEKIWSSGKKKKIDLPRNGKTTMSDILQDFAKWQKNTGIYGYCCGKLFSKELCKDVWFDESISLAEDFDFFLKLYPNIKNIYFTEQPKYIYLQETINSSMIISDEKIDYQKQLYINIHYKHFLEAQKVYNTENKLIVSQILSNYIFYSLFYCQIDKLEKCFQELKVLCMEENIELHGRNRREKLILWMFKLNCVYLIEFSLKLYRKVRKMVRG